VQAAASCILCSLHITGQRNIGLDTHTTKYSGCAKSSGVHKILQCGFKLASLLWGPGEASEAIAFSFISRGKFTVKMRTNL